MAILRIARLSLIIRLVPFILTPLASPGHHLTAQTTGAAAQASGQVTGTLVDPHGTPIAGAEIFLSTAWVLERDAQGNYHDAPRLPANAPFQILSPKDETPMQVTTNARGRFAFTRVSAGRYTVGLRKRGQAAPEESEYESVYNEAGIVAFDLAAGQSIDLGNVSRNGE